MEIKTAYKITVAVDDRRSEDFGIFLSKEVGLALSSGRGYYNGGGYSREIKVVNIDDNWYEVGKRVEINTDSNVEASLKQQALGKLTDQERKALGF